MSILKCKAVSKLTMFIFVSLVAAVALIALTVQDTAVAGNNSQKEFYTMDTQKVLEAHPAFQEAIQEYQTKMQEFQQQIMEMDEQEQAMMQQVMQQQMQQLGTQLQEQAFDAMQKDVQDAADKLGYDFIFDSNVLIVGGTDITDTILNEIADNDETPPVEPEPDIEEGLELELDFD